MAEIGQNKSFLPPFLQNIQERFFDVPLKTHTNRLEDFQKSELICVESRDEDIITKLYFTIQNGVCLIVKEEVFRWDDYYNLKISDL